MDLATPKRSLRSRLVLMMLTVVAIVSVTTIAMAAALQSMASDKQLQNTERQIRKDLQDKGALLSENHALALENLVLDNAFSDVDRLVRATVEKDEDVIYGLFVDAEGTAWTYVSPSVASDTSAANGTVDKDAWKELGIPDDLPATTTSTAVSREVKLFGHDILEFSRGVTDDGDFLGTVVYGVSTARMQHSLREARAEAAQTRDRILRDLGILLVINVLVGLALASRLARRITEPLAALTAAAARFAKGDLGPRVEEKSGDEVELLATTFNAMASDLSQTYQGLERVNHTLAAKVGELEASENKTQAILDSIGEGVFTVLPGEGPTPVNAPADELLALSLPEDEAESSLRLIDPDTGGTIQLATADEEGVIQREAVLQCGPSEQRHVVVRASPIRNQGGGPSQAVVSVRDVSQERSLERQLQQAQKMEALGRLAGGVAHDFNNLLTVILGSVELMKLGDDDALESAETIEAAAVSATEITRQLLAFSRGQEGGAVAMDLNVKVEQALRLLRRLVGERYLVVTELSDEAAWVTMDPTQFDQILVNLVVNAQDAMPTGGKIVVRTTVNSEEACLEVIDSGIGMPPEVRARIFDPFFTTKASGAGTGLGLATVNGIVKNVGGSIEVDSQEGTGTTFAVKVPLSAPPSSDEATHVELPLGNGERVLVIDDDGAVRETIVSILEASGYAVQGAATASEAKEIAIRGALDLIVCDVVLRGVSGPEVVRMVHAHQEELPVLYISGYTAGIVLKTIPGQAEFLAKPIRRGELLPKISAILRRTSPKVPLSLANAGGS